MFSLSWNRACTSLLSRLELDLLPFTLHLLPSTSTLQLQNESFHEIHGRQFNMWLCGWCLENEGMIRTFGWRGWGQSRSCFSTLNTQPFSWERGKSWNHQGSNFRHFEQHAGLIREMWRASSTSVKERDYGLHYSCPS